MYRVHHLVRSGRYPSLRQLAEVTEVTPRTVQRDLAYLREVLSAPLEYDPVRKGYYYTQPWDPYPLGLSTGEAAALILGAQALQAYAGSPWEASLRSLVEKLPLLLPDVVTQSLADALFPVNFGGDPPRGDPELIARWFEILGAAANERRTVHLRYLARSSAERTERDFDPYILHHHNGAWYAIGHCHLRSEVRMFSLDAIEEAQVTGRRFERPADFDLGAFLSDAWGVILGGEVQRVVVRFDAYAARWVRARRWHPSQELEEEPDGGVRLQFRVAGLEEIQGWVLSFGEHAEVVEPRELRERLYERVEELAARYRRNS